MGNCLSMCRLQDGAEASSIISVGKLHRPPLVEQSISVLSSQRYQNSEVGSVEVYSVKARDKSGSVLASRVPLTASLKATARWDQVDIHVKPRPSTAIVDELVNVWVRDADNSDDESQWEAVSFVEHDIQRFKVVTVRLKPLTTFQVKCSALVAPKKSEPGIRIETQPVTCTTKQPMSSLGYVANRKYKRKASNEISFHKGDKLEQVEVDNLPNQFECLRPFGAPPDAKVGFAPLYCLDRVKPPKVTEQSYYFATIDRQRTAIMLMRPNVNKGTFLLRPSEESWSENGFTLTVRSGVSTDGVPILSKFRLFMLSDGYGCFIHPDHTFQDVEKLVQYYRTTPIRRPNPLYLAEGYKVEDNTRHLTLDDFKVPKSSLTFQNKLGQGRFGRVYQGKFRNTSLDIAIKELDLPGTSDSGYDDGEQVTTGECLLEEALLMAKLFHENIVQLIAVCVDEPPFCLVSEFMNEGSLKKWLVTKRQEGGITLSMVYFILKQVASGMAYIEEKSMIHRDLRSDNVLVNREHTGTISVKIADFGLSRIIEDGLYVSTSRLLPIRWTAPEALSDLLFTLKSDVWSFGMLAFEVVTMGGSPYPTTQSNANVQRRILNHELITHDECRAFNPELCPDELYQVIIQCWAFDADDRPTFAFLASAFDCFAAESHGQYQ